MAVALLATVIPAAPAQDLLAGTWTIASSEPAPWSHAADKEVPADIRRLVGARVVLTAQRIEAPKPLACLRPRYQVKPYGAYMLFHGALEKRQDATHTPENVATALGFRRRPIPTLTTGCANGIEFHIIDRQHMLFALDNRVYRMTLVHAPPLPAAPQMPLPEPARTTP